jgi:clan AA aspartic protease (TIGR02281 family)
MASSVELRDDYDAAELRELAKRSRDPRQIRRLLALAAVYDGMSRAGAAKVGGMDRQTLRDWAHRFNAEGPEGLRDRPRAGRPRQLTDAQMAELAEIVETGPNGRRQTMALTLDTGATTIVLPREMIRLLGFQAKDLRDGWSRTAAGRVPIKLGRLRTVKVGHALAKDVAVAFPAGEAGTDPDDELALLGMSFLKRFRLTIEDAKDQIILMAK